MHEPNIYALWGGKQVAKGTPLADPPHRLVQVAGGFNAPREDGEENYSNLTKYGARTDWVNSLVGAGEPGCEATPDELAWLLWMFHGAEVVTAVPGPPAASRHTFVPSSGRGHWGSYKYRQGETVIRREAYNDTIIGRMQLEGSTANKAVRVTPRMFSLDPAVVYGPGDPAAGMPTDLSLLYTDGAGTFEVDGNVRRGQSQFTLVIDEDLTPVYGDDTVPHDFAQGTAVVTIGVTLLFDADALADWNRLMYGNANPAAGTKPLKTIAPLGSYSFELSQKAPGTATPNGRKLTLDIPGVKWTLPEAPPPNPDGGSTEIALAGSMRPVEGEEPYTLAVDCDPATVAFTT